MEIRLDKPDGDVIGTCQIKATGGLSTWGIQTCSIKKTKGRHDVWLVFTGV